MGTTWLPWSAASLASGAILLLLGALMLPEAADVAGLIASAESQGSRWMMASFAFFLAGGALTVGLPSMLVLLTRRPRAAVAALVLWSVGTVGTAAYAALLILFSAVVDAVELTPDNVTAIADDTALSVFMGVVVGSFYVAELWVAVALLRARSVSLVAPLLMLAHVASSVAGRWLPDQAQGMSTLLVSVALLVVAVQANDTFTGRTSSAVADRFSHQSPRW